MEIHRRMSIHSKLKSHERGFLRRCEVAVGGRLGLTYPLVPAAVDHWVMNVNNIVEEGKKEPQVFLERIIKEHHVKYEKIHPFIDFNGRTGRMLMNWERMLLDLPILIIHEGNEQQEYYKWFKE